MEGFIFDLDGVLADTAKYHFLGWSRLAQDMGFEFDKIHNEKQKGVSRMESLEILLAAGHITGLTKAQKEELAGRKNRYYLEMVSKLDKSEILPGIEAFLEKLKSRGYKIALGSASKSGGKILEQLGLTDYFDVIVDGNLVTKPKPDSEVFTKGADLMGIPYGACTVVEDAEAGVEAAKSAGMQCIGIGSRELLEKADIILTGTQELLDLWV